MLESIHKLLLPWSAADGRDLGRLNQSMHLDKLIRDAMIKNSKCAIAQRFISTR